MAEGDLDQSWYDLSVEEEQENKQKSLFSDDSRRSFPILSPLKEIDRSMEIREELSAIKEELLDSSVDLSLAPDFTTPKKTRLGPRAAQRHGEVSPSPSSARKVKLETTVDASPVSRNAHSRLGSPATRDVHARLGPRAASRHTTPEQPGSKRHLVRDSPLRDTDHKDKRHRTGTPTRTQSKTPNRSSNSQNVFSTPEAIRNKKRDDSKFKTPNSDSRIYSKRPSDPDQLSGKELFGRGTRRRGASESSKENDEPAKPLTESQIAMREKQVLYGKVTDGYQSYKAIVPKNLRNIRDPRTPEKDGPYSKRCWDGLIKTWRRRLHEWDTPEIGLKMRAVYSKNNKDLKHHGLITETGEVVMIDAMEPEIKEETPTEPTPEPQPLEPQQWNLPVFKEVPNPEDDARSVDSEYTRLLGNLDDFPESDEEDKSYRLSQDSHVAEGMSEEEEGEGEGMEIEDQFSEIAV